MYQTTIKVEGFITVTTDKNVKPEDITISLDVHEDIFMYEHDCDIELNETNVTSKTISTVVEC